MRITTLLAISLSMSPSLFAQSPARMDLESDEKPDTTLDVLEEVMVYGRSTELIGTASSASQGFVGLDDMEPPPRLRVGELVEAIPGMIATQHSGTGKANQYFLRGFNLDHGTDFSVRLNGMPLNMRTHGHGQGYLDLNPVIPELVQTIEYEKGPYSARKGDFSSAGSLDFTYGAAFDAPLLKVTAGNYGFRRALFATSNHQYTAAIDVTRYRGPWEIDENLTQQKAHLGWTSVLDEKRAQVHVDVYDATWRATDQIPLRAVQEGLIDSGGFIDPDLGGNSQRYSLNASISDATMQGRVYAVSSDFQLFSNFTYLLENAEFGDEFEQLDSRSSYGGFFEKTYTFDNNVSYTLGGEFHHDDIDTLGLNQTNSRARISSIRADTVRQTYLGAHADIAWQVSERLRANLGLRADYFTVNINARLAINSGSDTDRQISPKLNLAYRMSDDIEIYFNAGRGMHSNDARGAVISLDPKTGDPADRTPLLVPSLGREFGLRYESDERLKVTATLFDIELDSELVFVGDGGATEANDGSRRRGFEAAVFYSLGPTLTFDFAYTKTRARYRGAPATADAIPGSIETTLAAGINSRWNDNFATSIRVRYLGGAPLLEDNSVSSGKSLLTNAAAILTLGKTEIKLEALNLLDSDDFDVAYYYESRLQGEPEQGVSDVHYHPLEPRSLRLTLQRQF